MRRFPRLQSTSKITLVSLSPLPKAAALPRSESPSDDSHVAMEAAVTGDTTVEHSHTTLLVRAVIGLAQGLALFALTHAAEVRSWPATDPILYAPLVTVCIFAP